MRRNDIENDWYHVKGFSGVWSTDPWIAADMIGNPPRYNIGHIQQAHDFSRYALRNGSAAPATIDALEQAGKRAAKLQTAEPNTWESEGGTTAASKSEK